MAITTEGTSIDFPYAATIQQFVVPYDGLYKLEVWGGKGGNSGTSTYDGTSYSASGGNGGYSIGYKQLTKNTILYIVTGGVGSTGGSGGTKYNDTYYESSGGYNGGGKGAYNPGVTAGGGGGGATHIATKSGLLSAVSGSILIVAGGGGGAFARGGHEKAVAGGTGGGTSGGNGANCTNNTNQGGSQTSGGLTGKFGQGGSWSDKEYGAGAGGGGGGYYGGSTYSECGAGGGSGYIGGVPTIVFNGLSYSPSTTNGSNAAAGKAKITFVKSSGTYNLYHNSTQIKSITGKTVAKIVVNGSTVFES